MEGAREGDSGGTGVGGIRAALRKDRGICKAGGDGSTTVGDPERRKVVAGLYRYVRSDAKDLWVSRVLKIGVLDYHLSRNVQ